MSDETSALFTPTSMGGLHLKNRIIYPAMTRARFVGGLANDEVVKCMSLLPSTPCTTNRLGQLDPPTRPCY